MQYTNMHFDIVQEFGLVISKDEIINQTFETDYKNVDNS